MVLNSFGRFIYNLKGKKINQNFFVEIGKEGIDVCFKSYVCPNRVLTK